MPSNIVYLINSTIKIQFINKAFCKTRAYTIQGFIHMILIINPGKKIRSGLLLIIA
jgi:hypothetical protein